MRAAIMVGPGDVRIENVPDAKIIEPTDALIRVAYASVCGGYGAHAVLECVGTDLAMQTSLDIARPGGAIGLVGVPHDVSIPAASPTFFQNPTISGSPAPARAYFDELLPDILEGWIEPGRVFDFIGNLDQVPVGYQAMDERREIKALIAF